MIGAADDPAAVARVKHRQMRARAKNKKKAPPSHAVVALVRSALEEIHPAMKNTPVPGVDPAKLAKLASVDKIMRKYAGNELKLLERIDTFSTFAV